MKRSRMIVLRDDDISYFTEIDQFRTVHRLLLEKQVPFNIAVIPEVRADIQSMDGRFEGFIPPEFSGKPDSHSISENTALVSFVQKHPFIEVAQHGFSHQKNARGEAEFAQRDSADLKCRLEKGIGIIRQTFGGAPRFFVPPFDTVSAEALRMIHKRYDGISLSGFGHSILPMRLWPVFWIQKRMGHCLFRWGQFHLLQHPGLDFSFRGMDPLFDSLLEEYLSTEDVLVLPLHSWNFFSREGLLKKDLLACWEKNLRRLLNDHSVKFTTFSGLFREAEQ
jgi:hypothetical protein